MKKEREARDLGMNRKITRRDFLDGIAIGTGGAWVGLRTETTRGKEAQVAPEGSRDDQPPALTGMRGSCHPGSFDVGHRLRDGAFARFPKIDVDTGEIYDLVVVGGGVSGLAAAHFFRKAFGEDKKVLILDNHDDFGGHAKRNEFSYQGRTFIGYGGTMGISTPFPYSYVSKALYEDLGIEVERYSEFVDRDLYTNLELSRGMFFGRETFGEDRLVAGYGDLPWEDFFARAPLSEEVRRDLVRLHTEKKDYLPDLSVEEKKARLAKMSYQDFLLQVARITPDAIPFFGATGFRNNKRVDTCPALEAAQRRGAPGLDGLGLREKPLWPGSQSYYFHFPDGAATVTRMMVRSLIPAALPGGETMESSILARLNYAALDAPIGVVRIRLNSTVVRVEHEGPVEKAQSVRLAYVRDGKVYGVKGRSCILACWNSVIPYLMPELPARQKEALAEPAKVPIQYTNVFVRKWTAFQKLGVSRVSAPGMYHTSANLDIPVSIGGYRCSQRPEEPIIIHMHRNPNQPGLPRPEQQRAGMLDMLSTSFEEIELKIRDQLARMLGPGGFDPAEDILGITVNRYPHGYAYTPDTLSAPDLPEEERPHVVGRRRFGFVAIANADAGAAAFLNIAIDQAHRAVQELVRAQGLK